VDVDLKHIHAHGILLCDFRPENVLIDEFGILKVADFGNAREIPKQLLGATPVEVRPAPATAVVCTQRKAFTARVGLTATRPHPVHGA
jgi:serine/threonine protein kinase